MFQDIEDIHAAACTEGEHTYVDPSTGLTVFTAVAHNERGTCCGCGCRHCPYQKKCRKQMKSNTTTETIKNPRRRLSSTTIRSKNKVYTTTGDKGTSSLFTGERVSKDDCIFEALGTLDELNSFVGSAHDRLETECANHPVLPFLLRIMKVLLSLGSSVATPPATASARQLRRSEFDRKKAHVKEVEIWIDQLTEALPDLRTFVLPYGGLSCSTLHICRSVCRRAERRIIALSNHRDYQDRMQDGVKFLNRLSDFFFVAARYACYYSENVEKTYKSSEVDVACEKFHVPALTNIRNVLTVASSTVDEAELPRKSQDDDNDNDDYKAPDIAKCNPVGTFETAALSKQTLSTSFILSKLPINSVLCVGIFILSAVLSMVLYHRLRVDWYM